MNRNIFFKAVVNSKLEVAEHSEERGNCSIFIKVTLNSKCIVQYSK